MKYDGFIYNLPWWATFIFCVEVSILLRDLNDMHIMRRYCHIIIYIVTRTGSAVRCMNHTVTAPRCGNEFALHGAEIGEVGAAPILISVHLINTQK